MQARDISIGYVILLPLGIDHMYFISNRSFSISQFKTSIVIFRLSVSATHSGAFFCSCMIMISAFTAKGTETINSKSSLSLVIDTHGKKTLNTGMYSKHMQLLQSAPSDTIVCALYWVAGLVTFTYSSWHQWSAPMFMRVNAQPI